MWKKIIATLILVGFIAGCSSFNMEKFKLSKDGVEVEKVESKDK